MDCAMYLQGPRGSESAPPPSSQLQPSDQAESEGYPMRGGTRKAGEALCSVLWNFLSGAHAQPQSPHPVYIRFWPSTSTGSCYSLSTPLERRHKAQALGKARPLGCPGGAQVLTCGCSGTGRPGGGSRGASPRPPAIVPGAPAG